MEGDTVAQQPGFDKQATQGATAADAAGAPLGQPRPHQTSLPLGSTDGYAPRIGDIVNNIKVDGTRMLNDNIALAQAEVKPMAKHGGIGAGMFGGAGYLAMCGLALLFMAGGFGFAEMWAMIFSEMPILTTLALGYLTMALLLFVVAGILALLGKAQVSKIKKPEATIAEAKASIAALGESVKRGQQSVKVNSLDRAGLKQDKKAVAQYEKAADKLRQDSARLN